MAEQQSIRLGVFGGSFDPPHLAHGMLVEGALATGELDVVWMVPTLQHAFGKQLAPFADRVRMCELFAARFDGRVIVSQMEAELGGESRTLRLLEAIAQRIPEASLRLLVGADILAETDKWHGWEAICALAPPLVFGRTNAAAPVDTPQKTRFVLPDISSTEIRARVRANRTVRSLLPERIMRYISQRGLYS